VTGVTGTAPGEEPGAAGFVRPGRASDAPGLARIQVASWRAAFDRLVPAQVLQELSGDAQVSRFTGSWQDAIVNPPTSRHKVLVAYAAGAASEPVGFASVGPATDEDRWPGTDGQLYELHLLPGQAGTGHGGRLLHAVADTLSQDGFHAAYTWVLAADSARVEFLTAAGWAPDGSSANLDMSVAKVPVVRLHTRLAPGTESP
jgi:GNAT superfamily N-acetyltransferase